MTIKEPEVLLYMIHESQLTDQLSSKNSISFGFLSISILMRKDGHIINEIIN